MQPHADRTEAGPRAFRIGEVAHSAPAARGRDLSGESTQPGTRHVDTCGMKQRHGEGSPIEGATSEQAGFPGKRTRTESVGAVQRRIEPGHSGDPACFYPEPGSARDEAVAQPTSFVDSLLSPPSGGAELTGGVRDRMEGAFGRSFAGVRVHDGDGVAASHNAVAVAQGRDIHFAPGAYAPGTDRGDFLLGHELAHVVQQEHGGASAPQAKVAARRVTEEALELEADRAGAAAARGDRAEVHGAIGGAVAQCFGEEEHREMGDKATTLKGGARLYVTIGSLGYKVSYGELVAMGDYFKSVEQIEKFASKKGPGKDTQEAIEYVRWVKIGRPGFSAQDSVAQDDDSETVRAQGEKDGRFEVSHYSEETRKAVDSNYYKLASENTAHFPLPREEDGRREEQDRPESAGATYRQNHEIAIRRAVQDGCTGKPIDAALAVEAFGDHFLTDACSSGHLRMPRTDVTRWWNARDPGLLSKFRGYFVWRVTEWLSANTDLGRLPDGGSFVMSQVDDAFASAVGAKAELTMGILVSVALHDYDSDKGLHVLQEGKSKEIFGDGRLGEGATKEVAVHAARLGAQEVLDAYNLGKQGVPLEEVRSQLLGGGTQYKPELALPKLDPAYAEAEPMPTWAVETWEDLFKDSQMVEAMRITIMAKMSELNSIAASQPQPARDGIHKGFIDVVARDPIAELKAILRYGGAGQAAIQARHPGAGIGGVI